jgi:hypothetical protein
MEYNTTNEKLKLHEYGRNIQRMAEHCKTIPDRDTRTKAAHEIVGIMCNMFPSVKETRDYRQKLWDHLALMTDYGLDVDYPVNIERASGEKPAHTTMPYNSNRIKYRHYGRTTERMIAKAIELPEGDEKNIMVVMVANHMKKQYLTWNQNSVNDDIIKKDLVALSEGLLHLSDDVRLSSFTPQQQAAGGPQGNAARSGQAVTAQPRAAKKPIKKRTR